jgi:hypothetical protein
VFLDIPESVGAPRLPLDVATKVLKQEERDEYEALEEAVPDLK